MMAVSVQGVFAQNRERELVSTNNFSDNLFVSFGGGLNLYADGAIGKGPGMAPALDLSLGKWLTPVSGVRLGWAGVSAKHWGGSKSDKFPLNTVHADYLWNASATIWGYRSERLWSFIPFAGPGVAFGAPAGKTHIRFAVAGGLLNKVRLSKSLDANLELRAVMAPNRFDTVGGGKITGRTVGSITVGLSYKLGANRFYW